MIRCDYSSLEARFKRPCRTNAGTKVLTLLDPHFQISLELPRQIIIWMEERHRLRYWVKGTSPFAWMTRSFLNQLTFFCLFFKIWHSPVYSLFLPFHFLHFPASFSILSLHHPFLSLSLCHEGWYKFEPLFSKKIHWCTTDEGLKCWLGIFCGQEVRWEKREDTGTEMFSQRINGSMFHYIQRYENETDWQRTPW